MPFVFYLPNHYTEPKRGIFEVFCTTSTLRSFLFIRDYHFRYRCEWQNPDMGHDAEGAHSQGGISLYRRAGQGHRLVARFSENCLWWRRKRKIWLVISSLQHCISFVLFRSSFFSLCYIFPFISFLTLLTTSFFL